MAYFSVDHSMDDVSADDSVDECQVERRVAGRAEIQVLISTSCAPQVHVSIMNLGI